MNGIPKVIGELRSKYQVLQDDRLPIDIFTFTEVDLKLDVIPFDDLAAKYDADAALLMDFSGIYVDAEQYDFRKCSPAILERTPGRWLAGLSLKAMMPA